MPRVGFFSDPLLSKSKTGSRRTAAQKLGKFSAPKAKPTTAKLSAGRSGAPKKMKSYL